MENTRSVMQLQNQHQHVVKDNNVDSSSRFKWRIENISKLCKESHFSPIFTIGPHKWRLLAFQKGCNVKGSLSVYVIAIDCSTSRHVKFSLAIVGQTSNAFKKKDQTYLFTDDKNDEDEDFCFEDFIKFKELKNPSNGYIVSDACLVDFELCLTSNSKEELAPIAVMESTGKRDPVTCAFCQTFKVSESSGSMLHIANGKEVEEHEVSGPNVIHVHQKCMEWAPQVYYGDTIVNLEMEVARGSQLRCSCCGLKGACLGCSISSCKKTYHFPCALGTSGCRWDDDAYLMWCPSHSGMNKKRKRRY